MPLGLKEYAISTLSFILSLETAAEGEHEVEHGTARDLVLGKGLVVGPITCL